MIQENKLQKVTEPVIYLPEVHSIGIIGDPGCDGLGTYNMKVYAGTLEESATDDITLVVGDLVPAGTDFYYETISSITEEIASNDVYVLRGNHDTGAYMYYFGLKNYAMIMKNFAVVVLDNAMRTFEEEGLELLEQVLAMDAVSQVMITFHIPVPNHFIPNSVSEEEFARLKAAYGPWKEKVKYLVCGHVHSRFADRVDGIELICTGGGGALIEDVSEDIKACDVDHHMVHFYEEEGELKYRFANLPESCYDRERKDKILREKLEETVQGELMAHLKYLMFADRARRRGIDKIANLFEALASSEYHHARNFYSIIERPAEFMESVEPFVPGEEFEYQRYYKMLADYARENQDPLARQAYSGAAAAEKVHARLLKEAADMDNFSKDKIYVCPICGYVMAGDTIPERCPVCGGPKRQYEVFASKEQMPAPDLQERFEFRNIKPEEAEQAARIEQICFPPHEACSRTMMLERIAVAPELFLVAVDKKTGEIAGFLNGLATDESSFSDSFFTDAHLQNPQGKNVMLLGLDVLPAYRRQGLAREIMRQYIRRERENGRKRLLLTCLESKVEMYKKMGFCDDGIANSTWGNEEWHQMSYKME